MPILEAVGLCKSFPGVKALAGVSLRVEPGEVLAVVGENGAGKSTLMRILAGIYQPDAGYLMIDGRRVRLANVADAQRRGISLIHQELNLAENLSVAENLFLGREPRRFGPFAWLDRVTMRDQSVLLLRRVGLAVSPSARVGGLAPGHRQLVEIARSLSLAARVLIMDEPTSSLSQSETDRLYAVIDDLKRQGVTVVYISHRLAEVQRLADRVIVMRDGTIAGELPRTEVTHQRLVNLMVGRDLQQFHPRTHRVAADAKPRLQVKDLMYPGATEPINLDVRAGEIVGVAGLVGAGRTELAEALFGIRPVTSGSMRIGGQPVVARRPADAIHAGLFLVPEDRRQHGLVLEDSVGNNLSLPNLRSWSRLGWIRHDMVRRSAGALHSRLRIKSAGLRQVVGQLSGGNQQKVVFGKWLAQMPVVLVCDEPTRGVDVGAKAEIYAELDRLAGAGVAVLMISSDLEEILGMSDRVIVMHQGRIAGELGREMLNERAVMNLATGAKEIP